MASAAALAALMLGPAAVARAETHITEGYIGTDTRWTVAESPYVIDTFVAVTPGHTLTIDPGVVVTADSARLGYRPGISVTGSIAIAGTPDKRVSISGLLGITVDHGTAHIQNADISTGEGLSFVWSTASISSSTIADGTYGIYSKASNVSVVASRIENNAQGVIVLPAPAVFQVQGNDPYNGIGGIGNAEDGLAMDTGADQSASSVSISASSISGNARFAVNNLAAEPVHAVGNWWGSPNDPMSTTTNAIGGQVEYQPWLPSDPFKQSVACCSSVLFIPGMMGTRLSRPASWPVIGSTTDRLWEPISNLDVQSLYLGPSGKSKSPSIYSEGPIDAAFGRFGIYGKIMSHLDDMSAKGIIAGWKPFGYDWRHAVDDVVSAPQIGATSTYSLIADAISLASSSKTGKVSIVAHSNGGLIAQYLVKVLSDMGKADIVDAVVSVATPFLGTPQAALSLLHGSDQSIAGGLILKESVARGLGANMPSAYSLLPSREYFKHIFTPTIAFASTTIPGMNSGIYPKSISTYDGQTAFILDSQKGRQTARASDTSLAIDGNPLLMGLGDALHAAIDAFVWPIGISRWSIVGWDKPTASGMLYSSAYRCFKGLIGLPCAAQPVHEKIETMAGDGTVLAPSASYGSGNVVALDLKQISSAEKKGFSHSNILESSTTISVIDSILTGTAGAGTAPTPLGVSVGGVPQVPPTVLRVSTHSPVDLHVYDSAGRHTGPIVSTSSSAFFAYEEGIPGSSYSVTDQGDSFITLPDDGSTYSINIEGAGIGEFTFDAERKQGADTLDSVEFAGVPVTPLTVASTTISSGGSTRLASSSPTLTVDVDGDGSIDMSPRANVEPDPLTYLEALKRAIVRICTDQPRLRRLQARIDAIESAIKKGKGFHAHGESSHSDERVGHFYLKKLVRTDRDRMVDSIESLISRFE